MRCLSLPLTEWLILAKTSADNVRLFRHCLCCHEFHLWSVLTRLHLNPRAAPEQSCYLGCRQLHAAISMRTLDTTGNNYCNLFPLQTLSRCHASDAVSKSRLLSMLSLSQALRCWGFCFYLAPFWLRCGGAAARRRELLIFCEAEMLLMDQRCVWYLLLASIFHFNFGESVLTFIESFHVIYRRTEWRSSFLMVGGLFSFVIFRGFVKKASSGTCYGIIWICDFNHHI